MSIEAFNRAFTEVVGLEGRYSDDPQDPGNWTGGHVNVGQLKGTMYGISAAAYPNLDIISIDLARAKSIYFTDWWQRMQCNQFESQPFAIALFKQGVNMGAVGAVKRLQEALKINPVDGVVGNITVGMVNRESPKLVIEQFLSQCAWWYTQDTAQFPRYGKGWLSRVIKTAIETSVA